MSRGHLHIWFTANRQLKWLVVDQQNTKSYLASSIVFHSHRYEYQKFSPFLLVLSLLSMIVYSNCLINIWPMVEINWTTDSLCLHWVKHTGREKGRYESLWLCFMKRFLMLYLNLFCINNWASRMCPFHDWWNCILAPTHLWLGHEKITKLCMHVLTSKRREINLKGNCIAIHVQA